MACSLCGEDGHNLRTCPKKTISSSESMGGKDRMIIAIDNATEETLNKLTFAIMEDKRKISPNARGTIVLGNEKTLPHKLFQLLEKVSDGMKLSEKDIEGLLLSDKKGEDE